MKCLILLFVSSLALAGTIREDFEGLQSCHNVYLYRATQNMVYTQHGYAPPNPENTEQGCWLLAYRYLNDHPNKTARCKVERKSYGNCGMYDSDKKKLEDYFIERGAEQGVPRKDALEIMRKTILENRE